MDASTHSSFDSPAMGDDYFQKPDPRARVLLGFKVPQLLRDRIEGLLEIWKARAEVEGQAAIAACSDSEEREELREKLEAELKAMDLTYACNRLLTVSSDEALKQILEPSGLTKVPSSDEEWAQVRASFEPQPAPKKRK